MLDHLAEGAVEFVERVIAAFAGFLAPGAGHVFDIAAGAEMSTCAAEDGGADADVVFDLAEDGGQLSDHLQTHGVADVGAVDGDEQGGALFFKNQGFALG